MSILKQFWGSMRLFHSMAKKAPYSWAVEEYMGHLPSPLSKQWTSTMFFDKFLINNLGIKRTDL